MAKLSKKDNVTAGTTEAPEKGKVPFTTAPANGGGETKQKGEGKPNLVQKRREKISQAVQLGSPFVYVGTRKTDKFECICGSTGKNAIVLKDKDGKEVLVGNTCIKYTGVPRPEKEKKVRVAGQPGVSRQQKLTDGLAKFTAPFSFARKAQGTFTCICGGKGENQIVIRDANGVEFQTGATCASHVPGVELPKAQPKQRAAGVVGLKGTAGQAKEEDKSFDAVGD